MVPVMHDLMLQAAGVLAIVVACVHGYLGQARVIGPAGITRPMIRQLLQAVWQAGALHWAFGGAIFIAAPHVMGAEARFWVVVVMGAGYLLPALGNLWAMRARHPGGWLLCLVVALAAAGAA